MKSHLQDSVLFPSRSGWAYSGSFIVHGDEEMQNKAVRDLCIQPPLRKTWVDNPARPGTPQKVALYTPDPVLPTSNQGLHKCLTSLQQGMDKSKQAGKQVARMNTCASKYQSKCQKTNYKCQKTNYGGFTWAAMLVVPRGGLQTCTTGTASQSAPWLLHTPPVGEMRGWWRGQNKSTCATCLRSKQLWCALHPKTHLAHLINNISVFLYFSVFRSKLLNDLF